MSEAEIRNELIALITDKVGIKAEEVLPDADIEKDLGCTGDDFFELMEAYSKRFGVDMSGFLWYFHTQAEGHNLGSLIARSPDQHVQRIPVTLDVLVHSALNRKWSVVYPPHQIPEQRWDIRINQLLGLAVITWAVISLFRHC